MKYSTSFKSFTIGTMAAIALIVTPAIASADTTTPDKTFSFGAISISETIIGAHMWVTITTPAGSITFDPPATLM